MKKLELCEEKDAMIYGVFGGIAKYLEVDPTIVRLIGASIMLSGVGILPYFIAAWIIPYPEVSENQE